jgi:hypothetical protein
MSQDDHIQGLIKSVHEKLQYTNDALDAVPDEHVAEVTNCEAQLAEQLRTLNGEYSEASHSAEANALEDLDRRASTLLSQAQALKAAHEQLLSTINQIAQTAAPASSPQYEVPEVKIADRFAGKGGHSQIGVGRHEPQKKGLFAKTKDAFREGKAQAESNTASTRAGNKRRSL